MITHDAEMQTTVERIAWFQVQAVHLRMPRVSRVGIMIATPQGKITMFQYLRLWEAMEQHHLADSGVARTGVSRAVSFSLHGPARAGEKRHTSRSDTRTVAVETANGDSVSVEPNVREVA